MDAEEHIKMLAEYQAEVERFSEINKKLITAFKEHKYESWEHVGQLVGANNHMQRALDCLTQGKES